MFQNVVRTTTATSPRKLKRVVIREELVALTGDPLLALVLNQFVYWTERVDDFDLLLAEERARDPDLQIEPRQGWIYKSAEELRSELMLVSTSLVTLG